MAGQVYVLGANGLLAGTIDFGSDTIKARLFLTSATPNVDSTSMTGLGVTGNDVVLTSKTGPTLDYANDRNVYSCATITFPSQVAGGEVDTIVVFKYVTNDADSIPLAYLPITAVTPNGGDLVITIPSDGLFYLQS